MMKHRDFESIDFLKDEYFKKWSVNPDKDSDFYWNSFLETYPEKIQAALEAKAFLLSLNFSNNNLEEMDEVEQIELYEKILQYRPKKLNQNKKSSSPFFIQGFSIVRIAAMLAMAIMASLVLYLSGKEEIVEQPKTISLISKSAALGQKLTTILPDGSIVKLNSGSSIVYPESFDEAREVDLIGEAFFEVEKNPDQPFVVKTGDIRTTVLGTSFNVKCYGGNTDIEIAVLTGMVSVNRVSENNEIVDSVILNPMQMTAFSEAKKGFVDKEFSYNQILGWKDNLICFKNAGIDEVLQSLERWYGVKFTVNKEIPRERDFSGDYRNKSLDIILEGLSYTFDFNFKMDGQTITIY